MQAKKLVRKILPTRGVKAAEETYRKSRILTLQARYGFPGRGARIIAVTGTNGKTTTCNYINELLKANGHTTAMFTTALVELAGKQTVNTIHRTVALTAELLQFLKDAKAAEVDFIILEVTSHALDQHKLLGLPIEVAVMTNLTQDHLDYHGDMNTYAAAKARLFNTYCKAQIAILNRDDDWYDFFKWQSVGRVISYGKDEKSSVQLRHLELDAVGSRINLAYQQAPFTVSTSLVGGFNAYNAAAAATVGLALGLTPAQVSRGVAALKAVPGRMESINAGQDYSVIVDYAHTPDALENVLSTLKAVTKGRVLIVFGATGDRDKSKRPIMGNIAARHADLIFLTDDETYTEDGDKIRASVREGVIVGGGEDRLTEIADREKAIKAAFKAAHKDDVVLLAGIGHQDYRAMGGVNVPWDEREVARRLLNT